MTWLKECLWVILLFSVNGCCGAGLHPQQLWDWSIATLVKVQPCEPLNVPDPCLVEPHVIFNPLRFCFCTFATFQVVSSVRQEKGHSLQLAVTGSHALSRVSAAGQHNKVVCGDGDVCIRKKPRVPQKFTQSLSSWFYNNSHCWSMQCETEELCCGGHTGLPNCI